MKIQLPQKVTYIVDILMDAGYDAYAVGGCIRDSLLGKVPMDWDITTSARPKQVKALFSRTVDTGIEHGTVTILIEKEGFEVTTYRIDGEYEDSRHPKEVTFTPDLIEDLKRRDFTINAIAYNDRRGLVDAFAGLADLELGRIRCVGNPKDRFREDALRMMRAIRFAAQLGFEIEESTQEAIKQQAQALNKVSAERIQTELTKLLLSDHPDELLLMYETGITSVILPEFDRLMETEEKCCPSKYSVGEHTILSLTKIRPEKVLRLAMLLHVIAKPYYRSEEGEDGACDRENRLKGSKMAEQILRRLKFDNDTIHTVTKLVRVYSENPPLFETDVRKTIVRAGVELFPSVFLVKQANILAKSDINIEKELKYLAEYEKLYDKIIKEGHCLSIKDLAVTGTDLIHEGMKPGRQIGEALQSLFEYVLEQPKENQKEKLLKRLRESKMDLDTGSWQQEVT
ncbi:MAG: CCA tRNA nucleotidyltransferase [Lachnospiraceae bacterium]